ncbi:hypothetical protein EB233_02695 [Mesorhizobium erdmanii]|uniref:Uncharacterized protein n=1 Tax=Mesorhizobium erdmanii TaxID=1777866 RepID=A0A6M7UBA2_9HYPH|nr:hypothetical protein A8146_07955 [Mesorhizobium loti]QKC74581.1 hypothetical protein EB233_02695 [Mesorhizobium erdmanii]
MCIQPIEEIREFLGILLVHSNDGSAAHLGGAPGTSIIDGPGAGGLLTRFVALSHSGTIIAEAPAAKRQIIIFRFVLMFYTSMIP